MSKEHSAPDIVDRLNRLYVQNGTNYVQEAAREITRLRSQVAAKQARIDALMLEYCQREMTPEQVATWGESQRPYGTMA